jgi:hypothetical protein
MALHLVKVAVGIKDCAHLAQIQAERAKVSPPLRHLTRNAPRRIAEILDGGSIYWVIGGAILVRQRILAIKPDQRGDGLPCTAFHLDPNLVRVVPRRVRAFQGWRYLNAAEAPPDLQRSAKGLRDMPEELAAELRALGLL